MKKFSTEEKEKIETTRESIQSLLRTQDAIFDVLCEQIGIIDDTDVNWLFDYIYNTAGGSPEYTTYVKEKVYGSEE
jgi:hypothetical protein